MNIAQIEESLRELVETPFDNATFIYRLLEIYGAPKATVTKLRQANASGDTSEIVVKKKLVLRLSAKGKASSTVDEMAGDIKILKAAPRFLIATDGAELYAKDIKLDQSLDTSYDTLNDSFDFFLPLAGIERYQGVAENPADIKATARLAKLYDAILEVNPNWRDKEHVHELNQLMTRLLFCFFAEGTSIFSKGQFTNSIMKWSQEDGSDTSKVISDIFKSLSLSDSKRAGLPEYAKDFPYVNGGLFKDITALPNFTKRARRLLRECGELDWSTINPDIFGSMIQAIVEPDKRADMGLHYTSLSNIMKVLHPLFLLSLEEEFEAGRDSQTKLQKLLVRLTKIRVFDPACGSGNFLIIAYKELRKLEIRIFKRLKEIGQSSLAMTGIQLNQFFGIEYADFAAETAKLSLWISEYQMNHQFKDEFGDSPPDLPLRESGSINHGNALRLDWLKVCPIDTSLETYVVGNPPYLGSVQQTHEQKEDMRLVFEHLFKKYKDLDYVSAWFLKGSHYSSVTEAKVAFVSTNSITQGEQVSMLWPLIAKNGVEIEFAHLSFKWSNSAASNAAVICVIVGLRKKSDAPKFLYDKGLAHKVKNINAYLISADEVFIEKRSSPLSDLPRMDYGNKPTDGGNLLLSKEEKDELIELYPDSKNLIRKFTGSREFIQGIQRWCLWIEDSQLALAESIPPIAKRISSVRTLRANSNGLQANSNARTPHKFVYAPHKNKENIVVPCHFSERRNYLTVGFSDGEKEVIGNSAAAIFDAPLFIFGVLSSRLHIMWTATVGGRIKTDLRYSNTLVYNTFPLPKLSPEQIDELEERSLEILAARERNSGKTIAWQYDPETMPNDLLQAHKNLDSTLERICLGRDFQSDGERLEYLFKQYAALSNETELKLKARKK